jgi:hypothetical protein
VHEGIERRDERRVIEYLAEKRQPDPATEMDVQDGQQINGDNGPLHGGNRIGKDVRRRGPAHEGEAPEHAILTLLIIFLTDVAFLDFLQATDLAALTAAPAWREGRWPILDWFAALDRCLWLQCRIDNVRQFP